MMCYVNKYTVIGLNKCHIELDNWINFLKKSFPYILSSMERSQLSKLHVMLPHTE